MKNKSNATEPLPPATLLACGCDPSKVTKHHAIVRHKRAKLWSCIQTNMDAYPSPDSDWEMEAG